MTNLTPIRLFALLLVLLLPACAPFATTPATTTVTTAAVAAATAPATPSPPTRTPGPPTPTATTVPATQPPAAGPFHLDLPQNPAETNDLALAGRLDGVIATVATADDLVIISTGAGLAVVDVADSANPTIVGQSDPLPNTVDQVTAAGDVVYAALGGAGFWTFDIADPGAIQPLGQVLTNRPARHFVLDGDRAYVVDTGDEPHSAQVLSVVDIGDPAAPREIATFDLPFKATKLQIVDGYLYISLFLNSTEPANALWVVDFADPAAPVVVSTAPFAGSDMLVDGTAIFLLIAGECDGICASNELLLVDGADPAQPQLMATVAVPGTVRRLAKYGDILILVGDDLWTLLVYDLGQPNWTGKWTTPGVVRAVAIGRDYLYVADSAAGLLVLRKVGL